MKETIGNVLLNLDYYDGEDAYSDGSIEDRLLEIVKTTPKEDYQKVILTEKSWPIFYHLSPERENILDWYEWKDDASVFEVGAGCGAISGVLCRNAKRVVANDLSKRRSTINAYKNQDASNLEIMVGNFNVVAEKMEERFDYVTLIGVLEYAKSYIGKDNPYPEYLEKINRLLKPGGKILIAIENRLGLKYFAGCREDHVDIRGSILSRHSANRSWSRYCRKTVFRSLSFIIPIRITNFRRSFIRMNICRSRVN